MDSEPSSDESALINVSSTMRNGRLDSTFRRNSLATVVRRACGLAERPRLSGCIRQRFSLKESENGCADAATEKPLKENDRGRDRSQREGQSHGKGSDSPLHGLQQDRQDLPTARLQNANPEDQHSRKRGKSHREAKCIGAAIQHRAKFARTHVASVSGKDPLRFS